MTASRAPSARAASSTPSMTSAARVHQEEPVLDRAGLAFGAVRDHDRLAAPRPARPATSGAPGTSRRPGRAGRRPPTGPDLRRGQAFRGRAALIGRGILLRRPAWAGRAHGAFQENALLSRWFHRGVFLRAGLARVAGRRANRGHGVDLSDDQSYHRCHPEGQGILEQEKENIPAGGLRIYVQGGGCSGLLRHGPRRGRGRRPGLRDRKASRSSWIP